MSEFSKFMRALIDRAGVEAESDGSKTVEAQHLLLAIADLGGTTASEALMAAGLDHQRIRAALDREFAQSLGAAGVSLPSSRLPRSTSAQQRAVKLGASVQQAFERAFTGVPRDPEPAHLLLGILQAQVGTVPRALALAGVDRADLIGRVRQTLGWQ